MVARRISLWVIACVLLLGGEVFVCAVGGTDLAQGQTLQLETKSIHRTDNKDVYAIHDSWITIRNVRIFVTKATIHRLTKQIEATEGIRFYTPEMEGEAQKMKWNGQTKIIQLHQVVARYKGATSRFRAEKVEIFPDHSLRLTDCVFTNCPEESPLWEIHAQSVETTPQSTGYIYFPWMKLGGLLPVPGPPVIPFPVGNQRRSGFLRPQVGGRTSPLPRYNTGGYIGIPYYWAIDPEQDATIALQSLQNRGTAWELEYRYAFTKGQTGFLKGWRLKHKPRLYAEEVPIAGLSEAGHKQPAQRHYALFGHNQQWQAYRLITNAVDYSDGQFLQEFFNLDQDRPYQSYQVGLSAESPFGSWLVLQDRQRSFTKKSLFANTKTGKSHLWSDADVRPALKPLARHAISRQWGWGEGNTTQLSAITELASFAAKHSWQGQLAATEWTWGSMTPFANGLQLGTDISNRWVGYQQVQITPRSETAASSTTQQLEDEIFSQTAAQLELRWPLLKTWQTQQQTISRSHHLIPRIQLKYVEDVSQPYSAYVQTERVAQQLVNLQIDNRWFRHNGNSRHQDFSFSIVQPYDVLWSSDSSDEGSLKGPPIKTPQSTDTKEAWLPLQVKASWTPHAFGLHSTVHYHHQMHDILYQKIGMSWNEGALSSNIYRSRTKRRFYESDNSLFSKADTLNWKIRHWTGSGFYNVDISGEHDYLLAPRLRKATIAWSYLHPCYQLNVEYMKLIEDGAYTKDLSFKMLMSW